MDRAEAEAIYDSGREACVEVILELAGRVEQHGDRLRRLEEQVRQDSRTSSKPPSSDPPKTRAQRRAEARAKANADFRAARSTLLFGVVAVEAALVWLVISTVGRSGPRRLRMSWRIGLGYSDSRTISSSTSGLR